MKRILIPCLQILSVVIVLSGCADSMYKTGNKHYNNIAYSKAATSYEKALKSKNIPDARMKLADCYRKLNNSLRAEENYAQAVSLPEAKAIHKFYYAQALMQNGKCSEAQKWLNEYLSENPNDQVAKNMVASCNAQSKLMIDSLLYSVSQLSMSTPGSEFAAVRYKDGIVFTGEKQTGKSKYSPYTGRPYYSLYYSKLENNKWGKAEPLNENVNKKLHNTTAIFTRDGNTMFYTANNLAGKKSLNDSLGTTQFSVQRASLQNDKWTSTEMLPFTSREFSTGHPSLSDDGSTLYFVSDMQGGMGGTDIYMVKFENGSWGNTVNLGTTVNTSGNEMFPSINGNTLYYSSDGLVGMGGLDIYKTKYENSTWSTPVNMGYPVNSTRDDFSFMPDSASAATGYFSSNRNSETGTDHIFSFVRKEYQFIIDGMAVEKDSDKPIAGATVTLVNKTSGTRESVTTGDDGTFTFRLNPESEFTVEGSKEKYFKNSADVSTVDKHASENMVVHMRLEVEPVVVEKPMVVPNIYYDYDKAAIRSDAAKQLDSLAGVLKENPTITIELMAHTDSRGTNEYNNKLSQRRADAAVKYLTGKGVAKTRMTAKGYGETMLTNNCKDGEVCDEASHQANRRTEFKVTGFTEEKK
jgi:outer membrane protein OmpA-like peptidoglycan-associated protein